CNVAGKGGDGQQLLNHLKTVSGADVYASSNLTGSAAKHGDWILEAASKGSKKTLAKAGAAAASTTFNTSALAQWDQTLAPGITVSPTSGLTTTEAGGTATFTVVLNQAPGALDTVNVPISTD